MLETLEKDFSNVLEYRPPKPSSGETRGGRLLKNILLFGSIAILLYGTFRLISNNLQRIKSFMQSDTAVSLCVEILGGVIAALIVCFLSKVARNLFPKH